MLNPVEYSKKIEKIVTKGVERKYYRLVRPARFYGGISSSDCSGCNLRCIFCWSNDLAREGKMGDFYSPEEVFNALVRYAKKFNYTQFRVTGNEPTIGREHLLKILELVDQTNYSFTLETNGILIGYDKSYARDLAKFNNLHVRVSIKGTNEKEFGKLTLAEPNAFHLQLQALKNLLDEGVSCHPAAMLSFCGKKEKDALLKKLREIDETLVEDFEEEYVFLYSSAVKRLEKFKTKPIKTFSPNRIPEELI
ncbi:MAG: radical SAM protein [Candidatus Aenigmarchaeota archaeon]|nr:radical SAM protein [Candidatus Aenigmarchaeota archaeon]